MGVDLDRDPDEAAILELIVQLRKEADVLAALIPIAIESQWTPAPVARPREDTTERVKNGKADPTSVIALDSERQICRAQVVRSQRVLRHAVVALREVRLSLRRAVDAWNGEVP